MQERWRARRVLSGSSEAVLPASIACVLATIVLRVATHRAVRVST